MFTVTKTLDPEKHQATLTVTFDPQALDQAKRRIAREYAKHLHIPGFRPGKAPYALVARRVGERTLAEEGLRELLDQNFDAILQQAEVEAGAPATLESLELDPPTVVLRVPLKPEVTFKTDYKALRVPYEPPEVTDEDVEQALDSWRRVYVSMETVERPAQVGDVVIMDLKGELRSPEGETTELEEQEVSLLVKDDEDPEEWPYPGFSKELAGLKAGDEKTMTYTYPDDAVDETLRGKTATYHVHVKEVQAPVFPELTDEFVRENTEYDSLEALREATRKELAERKQREYHQDYLGRVLDALLEQVELRYPPELVDQVYEEIKQRAWNELRALGVPEETLHEMSQNQEEQHLIREQAEQELRRRLVLDTIADELNIEPGEEAKNALLERVARDLLALANYDLQKARRLQRERPDLAADLFAQHYALQRRAMTAAYVANIARGKSHEEALAALWEEANKGAQEPAASSEAEPEAPAEPTEPATEADAAATAEPEATAPPAEASESTAATDDAPADNPDSAPEPAEPPAAETPPSPDNDEPAAA